MPEWRRITCLTRGQAPCVDLRPQRQRPVKSQQKSPGLMPGLFKCLGSVQRRGSDLGLSAATRTGTGTGT